MTRLMPWTAITTLVWLILTRMYHPTLLNSVELDSDYYKTTAYVYSSNILYIFLYILLPFTCALTELKFGRLNAPMIYACIEVICSLLYIILSVSAPSAKLSYLMTTFLILPITTLVRYAFEVTILCIGTDQLIEKSFSSDLLSSYIWWHYWCLIIGLMTTETSNCLFTTYQNYTLYGTAVHLVITISILVCIVIIKRQLVTYPYTTNPFILICSVLCFAVKNKYPSNRSALTFWEEREPSRINLGKAKYGGPFEEKDVESVKTGLRLFPMIAIVTTMYFPFQVLGRLTQGKLSLEQCLLSGSYFIEYFTSILIIPLYQCVMIRFNCFQRIINISILKKIGFGFVLIVLGKLGYVSFDLYISIAAYDRHNESAVCLLQTNNSAITNYDDKKYHFFVLPDILNALGVLLVNLCSLEFLFAQSPHSMYSLFIGLWYSMGSLFGIAGRLTTKSFKQSNMIPSCELYILIMNFAFMTVGLILFLLCSRYYKLSCKEDNVYHAHNVVERYYEDEFCRRDKFGRSYDSFSSSNLSEHG